ncbi:Uu.00g051450.m01.CDS01 [Anthostomella pinea]|uniref:Uu.00g051450.m01.CDS01 n=1 Tax=Anthostomella pinea TaxID=933095 RepID=A0AAI8YMQ1_9PEZI|nr:Uu.00g051450.m01.CDS01 [Anthostomella pinea]
MAPGMGHCQTAAGQDPTWSRTTGRHAQTGQDGRQDPTILCQTVRRVIQIAGKPTSEVSYIEALSFVETEEEMGVRLAQHLRQRKKEQREYLAGQKKMERQYLGRRFQWVKKCIRVYCVYAVISGVNPAVGQVAKKCPIGFTWCTATSLNATVACAPSNTLEPQRLFEQLYHDQRLNRDGYKPKKSKKDKGPKKPKKSKKGTKAQKAAVAFSATVEHIDLGRDILLLESCLQVWRLLRVVRLLSKIEPIERYASRLTPGTSWGLHTGSFQEEDPLQILYGDAP